MFEFLLTIGILIFIIWLLTQLLKAIFKIPSKIIYHASGQAEIDKINKFINKQRREEEKIEFERKESDRKKREFKEFSLEVETIASTLRDKDIVENVIVVIRKDKGTKVHLAKFNKLWSSASFETPNPMYYPDPDRLRPGWIDKKICYSVYDPIVIFDAVEKTSIVSKNYNYTYEVSEHSIVKANPEFVAIYDDKILKPLREKGDAEQAEKIKLENAKSMLDSIFK
jgi:hypothetical protein